MRDSLARAAFLAALLTLSACGDGEEAGETGTGAANREVTDQPAADPVIDEQMNAICEQVPCREPQIATYTLSDGSERQIRIPRLPFTDSVVVNVLPGERFALSGQEIEPFVDLWTYLGDDTADADLIVGLHEAENAPDAAAPRVLELRSRRVELAAEAEAAAAADAEAGEGAVSLAAAPADEAVMVLEIANKLDRALQMGLLVEAVEPHRLRDYGNCIVPANTEGRVTLTETVNKVTLVDFKLTQPIVPEDAALAYCF
jgi:hypothetical protein